MNVSFGNAVVFIPWWATCVVELVSWAIGIYLANCIIHRSRTPWR